VAICGVAALSWRSGPIYALRSGAWLTRSTRVDDGSNEYGTFSRVEGMLDGPIRNLQVVCIGMKQAIDGKFRFVTLKPAKRRSGDVSSTVGDGRVALMSDEYRA